MLTEIIGVLGAFCFAVCAVPQVVTTLKLGHADSVSSLFLMLWTVGEVAMIFYVLNTSQDWILMVNYIFNLICLVIILKYKFKPRSNNV